MNMLMKTSRPELTDRPEEAQTIVDDALRELAGKRGSEGVMHLPRQIEDEAAQLRRPDENE